MKILITGGSGFIGSHLVDGLLEQGHEVKIYDIETPRFGQPCASVKADVMDLARLLKESVGQDIIYHLAAEANVNRFFESPFYSNCVTSSSTINVLEAARKNAVSRVLLASTEWVYGSSPNAPAPTLDTHPPPARPDAPITEDTPVASRPDHIYTSSKIAAELFCLNYQTMYGVKSTIMRFGIPFGERARPETVTPIFIRKIVNGEDITIHGDGSQTRQFVYVKELARGCAACLDPKAANEIFNLNGRERVSVLEIIRNLEDILQTKARITFVEQRAGQFKGRMISSEKAKRILGWEPRFSYQKALETYARAFAAELRNTAKT
jgi:UDP-glucose 4-epimerase